MGSDNRIEEDINWNMLSPENYKEDAEIEIETFWATEVDPENVFGPRRILATGSQFEKPPKIDIHSPEN